MKRLSASLASVLLLTLSLAAWSGQTVTEDLTIVTGKHWTGASLEQKRAYLFGIGNVLEIEQAMAGDDYESMRGRSIVPVLLEGLSGTSIADMVRQLDEYYAGNPEDIDRPVIEVLYLEMALARLES